MIGRTQGLTTEQDDIETDIPNDEYYKHKPEKEDHHPKVSHWKKANDLK